MLRGGHLTPISKNAYHRTYIRKFKKGQFPNRTRSHWNVTMKGLQQQRPRRLPWPYDLSSMIFNQPTQGSDKIGYVVDTKHFKTAIVASNYLVYYPRYNQKVARTGRYQAHDEDLATVEGDLVHIKMCRKISRHKHYYVFSILDPNIEGRERLKLGLPAVPPPMFGYPTTRRIVKLNLTSQQGTKEKLAASIQENVQDFYRYAASSTEKAFRNALEEAERNNSSSNNNDPNPDEEGGRRLGGGGGFDDMNQLVGVVNAPPSSLEELSSSSRLPHHSSSTTTTMGNNNTSSSGTSSRGDVILDDNVEEHFTEEEEDKRTIKGEDYHAKKESAMGIHGQDKSQRSP